MLDNEEKFVYVVVKEYNNIRWTETLKVFYTERAAIDFIYECMAHPSQKNFREGELSYKYAKTRIE
jgi:hypothetical protein